MRQKVKNLSKGEGLLNLGLRALAIGAKFLLSILIVKKLTVADLGVYGILQTTITLLIYILGFDFYTYNAREILKKDQKSLASCIINQLAFHGLVYLIVIPISFFLFMYGVIETKYMLLFYLLLVSEHLSQELYRLLIVLKRSVIASLILFIRSGVWIFLLALIWFLESQTSSIYQVLIYWLAGAWLSVFVGIRMILPLHSSKIDFNWIKKGIIISLPFFVGTIFYKIMEFSGRYFLDYYGTKEDVGVFTFFSSLSNTIFVFVQATVIMVYSPYLIEHAQLNSEDFKKYFSKFKKKTLINTLLGSFLGAAFIYPFLIYLDNKTLSADIYVFFVLLLATISFCISYIPHYKLYVFNQDIHLLKASIIGAVCNLFFNFILVPNYGVEGAAYAQFLGMFSLLIAKTAFSFSRKT
ncbi:polysaccharide biosynthesis C-terminal domain-containing protein [Flagellimonas oceanensis]|uniref:polysaccharide biosynthesis C-terminal domain-containing protein n=1 Tax=Flagellimonas oceanensis TaxID=2499163 RepID=UPI0013DF356B|nr:polysaccharide biosynthesis C-terminal domain-containing protein [Allomuricauda oceanensis]